jgi:hypothetical protein
VSGDRHFTVTDARRLFCASGIKAKAAALGIVGPEFRDFLRNGISADDARLAGDAQVEHIIASKRKGTR